MIWAAKPNGSLYRWDGKTFGLLPTAGLPASDSQVSTMLVTRDGQCWVATANNLLLYKDPGTAADEVKVVKLAKPDIISLAEDRENTLWAGTSDGKIWRLRQGQWQAQTNLVTTKAITSIVPELMAPSGLAPTATACINLKMASSSAWKIRNMR